MLLRSATVRDLDRLTARVFDTATRNSGARLDAYRIDDTFYIDIDLPGVDPASIDVTVDRKVLTVRAERKRTERRGPAACSSPSADGHGQPPGASSPTRWTPTASRPATRTAC